MAGTGVDPYSFQAALATKALEQKVVLAHPSAIYKMLHFHYRDEIKREVAAEMDRDDNDNDKTMA